MDEIQVISKKFAARLWRTRGARFLAVKRLRRVDASSTFGLAMLSFYGIAVSVFQLISPPVSIGVSTQVLSAILVLLSILVLVLSLLEGGNKYSLRAERLDRNALEIGELLRELELKSVTSNSVEQLADVLRDIEGRYSRALRECTENHEAYDDKLFAAQNRLDSVFSAQDVGALRAAFYWTTWTVHCFWLSGAVIALPPLVAWIFHSL